MSRHDGGPAFPVKGWRDWPATGTVEAEGISIRAYIATAIMAGYGASSSDDLEGEPASVLARWAVDAADALIAELAKP